MVLIGSPSSTQQASPRRGLRRLAALAVPTAVIGATLLSAPAANADAPAAPGTLTVDYSSGPVVWTVPAGTYDVWVTAVGGSGADGSDLDAFGGPAISGAGGRGAMVQADLPVVPGEQLHLEPGSAGFRTPGAIGSGPLAPGGDGYQGGSGGVESGGGGAGTVIRANSAVLAVAGGGGGGGAGSVQCPGGAGGDGGAPGTAGNCSDGGAGGSGAVPEGTGPLGAGGRNDSGNSGVAGGGGGGGLDDSLDGGGRGGAPGDLSNGGGGGGGGAGGPSFAVDPSATIGVAQSTGDGWVKIDWTPGLSPASTLSAPGSVQQGSSVTLTDLVAPPRPGLPQPTGSVTFDQVDPATNTRTVLGTADLDGGQATLSADLAGVGPQAVEAFYSGDSTYFSSTSGYALTTVVPTPTTLSITPSPLSFGNVVVGTTVTKTITLTNAGDVGWSFAGVRSDTSAVGVPGLPCATLAPGASCTATVSFRPTTTGPVNGTLTLSGDAADIALSMTGTGVAARPVVTHVSPASGSRRGGTLVTITGRNFTGVTAIRIGSAAMTSVTCPSSTTCTAVTPRGTGTRAIRVTTATGTSPFTRADRFTYR